MTKLLYLGLSPKAATEIDPLAKSWLSSPGIELSGNGFESSGFDAPQRAYAVVRHIPTVASNARPLARNSGSATG